MKKYAPALVAILLLFVTLLSACASAAAPSTAAEQRTSQYNNAAPAAPMADGGVQKAAAPGLAVDSSSTDTIQRLVIRNATLDIVVKDPGASMVKITKMAEDMKGYVVTSTLSKISTQGGIDIPQAQISVRIPADRLNEALDKIKSLVENGATDILSENVTGQDVTKEYTDQKSRLTNLESYEKQLQKFLEETSKTEDALAVYNQLVSVREQIEVTKGQIKYYEESAALSSVNVTLTAQASVKPVTIAGWQPVGVARDAVQALINTLQFLGSATIWLVIFFLPIGLLFVLAFFILKFIFRRIFKSRPKPVKSVQPAGPIPPSGPIPPAPSNN